MLSERVQEVINKFKSEKMDKRQFHNLITELRLKGFHEWEIEYIQREYACGFYDYKCI